MNTFRITRLADNSFVPLNVINHCKSDFSNQDNIFIQFGNTVYPSMSHDAILKGQLGVNTFVRNHHQLAFNDCVQADIYQPSTDIIKKLDVNLRLFAKGQMIINLHEDEIKDELIKNFKNYHLFTNQCLYIVINNNKIIINITNQVKGYITKDTTININSDDSMLNVIGSKLLKRDLFREDYNFEEIGIGGLNKELVSVLRRCLSTRSYKKSVIQKLGIKHVKGMLLYGPPGGGKTLIARRIGNMISNKEPKVVNGPEIMNKFVGESEKNIRDLFADAIADNDKENSELHVIIFDEIDAICKTRGRNTSSTGVNDSVVNQLLTMIEGYKPLNNIFIIAMTNRKDLLDEALLRAGRLEVHIEIGLPNKEGREQIFRIHTNNMSTNSMLDPLINISELAELTENYSGAEIEAVVRNAGARALHEGLITNIKDENIVVMKKHFIAAIDEIIPSFGNITMRSLSFSIPENYNHLTENHKECYDQIRNLIMKNSRLKTSLIIGKNKSGKSTLATKIALDSKIKNTKIIRAIDLISFDEINKVYHIADLVKNSYISEESLIVLDDIEIAINYAKMGKNITFSNRLYQVLVTLLKTDPTTKDHKITFICTCTDEEFAIEISNLFDLICHL